MCEGPFTLPVVVVSEAAFVVVIVSVIRILYSVASEEFRESNSGFRVAGVEFFIRNISYRSRPFCLPAKVNSGSVSVSGKSSKSEV